MADENQTPQNQGTEKPQPAQQPAPEAPSQPAQPAPVQPAPAQPTPEQPATQQPATQQPPAQPTPAPQAPTPEQPTQPAQPQQPQVKPAPTIPAKPESKPGVKPAPAKPVPGKPGQKPTRKPPNPRRLLWGCAGCSGIALFFFIILVLVFVAQTTSTGQNPLAQSLGVSTASLTNTLILLVNLIFGAVSLGMFVLATIGAFRFFMARKDDKVARNKGLTMAGVSSALLIVFVFIWIGIYLFMTSRQVAEIRASGIVTEPTETTQLTAPINIVFDGSNLPISTNQYEILSYLWDFGDGNTSTVPLTSNTYTDKGDANGRFDVSLQVTKRDRTTGEESIDTFTRIVTIANVELGAIFTATPDRGPAPLTVEFDASFI